MQREGKLENLILDARKGKKFKISEPKQDGGYYQFNLPTDSEGKRRKIRAHTRLEVLKEVYLFYYGEEYAEESQRFSFKEAFDQWVDDKETLTNCHNVKIAKASGTIHRYRTDYLRFFAGKPIEKVNMKRTNGQALEKELMICFEGQPYLAAKNAYGYIRGLIEFAYKNRQIPENYYEFMRKDHILSVTIVPEPKPDGERYLNEEQTDLLYKTLREWEQKAKKPNLAHYALELALETGMRSGEIVALKWSDIHSGYIHIDTAERREGDGAHTIVEPKCKKHRKIVVTDEIKDILNRVEQFNPNRGDNFIFINQKGNRFTGGTLANSANRFGKKIFGETFNLSVHQLRRTKNADMERAGVPIEVRCENLGHTPETNLKHYTGQNATKEQQLEVLGKVSVGRRNNVVEFRAS